LVSTAARSGLAQDLKPRIKVRNGSWLAGREGQFWHPTPKQHTKEILFAAKLYDHDTTPEAGQKRTAKRNQGHLGAVGLAVLQYLVNIVNPKTGRLDPSVRHLSAQLKLSKTAIRNALNRLRLCGFIEWIRRYIPADDPSGRVQVQQTTNAYALKLPKIARKILDKFNQNRTPDDAMYAAANTADQIKQWEAELEQSRFEETKLGKTLARLGKAIKKKEAGNIPDGYALPSLPIVTPP
jgi:predicted transcriptional regulator